MRQNYFILKQDGFERKYVSTFIWAYRKELKVFFIDKCIKYLHKQLYGAKVDIQIAYIADIFAHLHHLNLQLQGSSNVKHESSANIFVFEHKVRAFVC